MWDYSNRWTRLVGKADLLETASAGLNRRVRPCGHSDTEGGHVTVNRSLVAAVALIAAIAMSAIGATPALGARTAASPFELSLDLEWSGAGARGGSSPVPSTKVTFAARAPFCRSGTVVELQTPLDPWGVKYRFTCDDGSGSVVVSSADVLFPWLDPLGLEPPLDDDVENH